MIISTSSIEQIISENDYKLLGQIPISDDEYEYLVDYARRFIKNASLSLGPRVDLLFSIALVQIAIREYKEGKYWGYFEKVVGETFPSGRLNYGGQVFAVTVKKYNMMYVYRDNNTQMYVENIKMHAFVTNYYMQGFFDFSYSYYENNLLRQIGEDLEEDLEMLSLFMNKTVDDNSDTISDEEVPGRASKSYKLLKSTRAVIANAGVNQIEKLIRPIMIMIDNYYYDLTISDDSTDRYAIAFREWCRLKEKNEQVRTTKNKRLIASRRPYIQLDMNKLLGCLVIPIQKFRENECEGEVTARIVINGYEKELELEVYKSFGLFLSEEKRIPIPSIFDQIDIFIETTVIKSYRIRCSNYRLFNKDMNSINKLIKDQNYIFTQKEELVEFDEKTKLIDSTKEYNQFDFYTVKVTDESTIHIGNKTISVMGEYSDIPYFEEEIDEFDIIDEIGSKLIVTRSHPTVSFRVSEERLPGTTLIINGIPCPIEKMKNKLIYDTSNAGELAIVESLEGEIPSKDGVYTVELDIPGINNKQLCKYVYIKKMTINTAKTIYSFEEKVIVRVKHGHEIVWPVQEEVELVGVMDSLDEYFVPINGDETMIPFHLALNEDLIIQVPICLFRFGFSKEKIEFMHQDAIWYSDIRETLYCSAPKTKELVIYLNHEKDNRTYGEYLGDDLYRFDLSEIILRIKDELADNPWLYINVICRGERKRAFRMLTIQRQLSIEPYFEFKKFDGVLGFNLTILGDAELRVNIEEDNTHKLIIENKTVKSGVTLLSELDETKAYNIIPEMHETDFFGLSTRTQSLKPIFNLTYVGLDDLVNYRITIADLLFEDEKKKLSYEYFIDIRENLNKDVYEGNMYGLKLSPRRQKFKYETDQDGRYIKKKFGKIKIQIESINEDSIMFKLWTYSYPNDESEKEWVELYYDQEMKTLLHSNDHVLSHSEYSEKFAQLKTEKAIFKAMIKKIRRMRSNVI